MSESYKKIFPGNYVQHLNAHALPNADFATNKRAVGDPRDRHQQAVVFCPGWLAVRKVGYCRVTSTPTGEFDFTLPSPDLRPDDKPRADIVGLHIPEKAYAVRAGFRVVPASSQPGAPSSGPRDDGSLTSGIVGKAATDILALASATPSSAAAMVITATAISTATNADAVIVDADKNVPIGSQMVSAAFGTPQQITATGGLTLKLYAMNKAVGAASDLSTQIIGGAFIVAELVYLVPEDVVDLDAVHLGGVMYSGNTP